MKTFDEFLAGRKIDEALTPIQLGGVELQWNPNKTEQRFKEIILQRTQLSLLDFTSLIQEVITDVQPRMCPIGDTCIIFNRSKFILVINKVNNTIVTIRDTTWEKPINDKDGKRACHRILTFESLEVAKDYVYNILEQRMDFNGWKLELTESLLEYEVHASCDCCLEVEK